MSVNLHPQLSADCFQLGQLNNSLLLLHKNALVPWFILIPDATENELFKLPLSQQLIVNNEVSDVAKFVNKHFKPDKLNIATIGNIVPQLHIHVIARFMDDIFWPKPVWGQTESSAYTQQEIQTIKDALQANKIIQD